MYSEQVALEKGCFIKQMNPSRDVSSAKSWVAPWQTFVHLPEAAEGMDAASCGLQICLAKLVQNVSSTTVTEAEELDCLLHD